MDDSAKSRSEPTAPHPRLDDYYRQDADRRPFVDRLFDRTAVHYDRITDWMSLGSGLWYRRQALIRAGLKPGMTMLDVAIGTGQVARAGLRVLDGNGRLLGLDPSLGMLGQARRTVPVPLPLLRGFAERIPLADGTVDFLSMGYALRHVSDLVVAFREYRRVLKPGGVALILELTRPSSPALFYGARFYLRDVVPGLCGLLGGKESRTLMRYFWDTIENCVPPDDILDALASSGLEEVGFDRRNGIFGEYTAVKSA